VPRIGAGKVGGGAGTGGGGTTNAADFAPGGPADLYPDYGQRIAGVIETMSRWPASLSFPAPGAGTMALTYFTPDQTVTVTTLTTVSRGTAGVGTTLARMGLYTAAANGDLTCVARTAADATLWGVVNTTYSRAITDNGAAGTPAAITSYTVTRGQRYAFATLHVGSTTSPSLAGATSAAAITALPPRLFGYVTAQTDIPATVAGATIAANTVSANAIYGRLS
jgi:hypothetical protein